MKKGFTLIELLTVIIVLAIILVIAIPKVITTMNNARIETYKVQVKKIKEAASYYISDADRHCAERATGGLPAREL